MQSSFHEPEAGQAVIRNETSVGSEQLVVKLHRGSELSIEIQIKEETMGDGLVTSAISVRQPELQKLVQWLREQSAVT
jgi:hypothetical protein